MYTEMFSVIQPVMEQKLENILSLARELGMKEVKQSDGVFCNLKKDEFIREENFSSLPSTSQSLANHQRENT